MATRKARTKRTTKTKARKSAKKRSTSLSNASPAASAKANQRAQWKIYRQLHAQVQKAWAKLKSDVEERSHPKIVADHKHLLLLMGECNYMLQECIRLRDQQSQR